MQCKSSITSQRPKSHIRETSLFTGAIPNQVRNSQTSSFGLYLPVISV